MSEQLKEKFLLEKGYLNDCQLKGDYSGVHLNQYKHQGFKENVIVEKDYRHDLSLAVSKIRVLRKLEELTASKGTYATWYLAKGIEGSLTQVKFGGQSFHVPYELLYIVESLKESQYIIELKSNWDDEGAYVIPEFVWLNAIKFVLDNSLYILRNYLLFLEAPIISPCVDGSIDILWTNKKARILFNFRNSSKGEVHFYGDDYVEDFQIKGSFLSKEVVEYLANYLKVFCK